MRDLSKKSEIPYETLKRWYYEKESTLKNEGTVTNQDNSENQAVVVEKPVICIRCGKNQAEINSRIKKPAGWRVGDQQID